jgi:hypothetical protein
MSTPIDMAFDGVAWRQEEHGEPRDGIPVVTHSGVLRVGDLEIEVYRLSDGQAVISQDGLVRFLEWLESGST